AGQSPGPAFWSLVRRPRARRSGPVGGARRLPGLLRPGRYTQGLQPRGQWLVAQIGLVILEGTCNLIAKLRLVKKEAEPLNTSPGLVAQYLEEQLIGLRGAISPSQYNGTSQPAEVSVRRDLCRVLDQAGKELIGFFQ